MKANRFGGLIENKTSACEANFCDEASHVQPRLGRGVPSLHVTINPGRAQHDCCANEGLTKQSVMSHTLAMLRIKLY